MGDKAFKIVLIIIFSIIIGIFLLAFGAGIYVGYTTTRESIQDAKSN